MTYKLELPPSSHVYRVFHVSFLKKVIINKIQVQIILQEIVKEGKIILEPKKFLETRIRELRNQTITNYISKRNNIPVEEETWEDDLFM
jgi:hypothetical protein